MADRNPVGDSDGESKGLSPQPTFDRLDAEPHRPGREVMTAPGPTRPAGGMIHSVSPALRRWTDRIRKFQGTLLGWYISPLLATLGWSTLWAAYDAAVVGYAFRCSGCAFPGEWLYWVATWLVLFPLTSILAFRKWAWLPILAVWLGGWEDILFYWVEGRAVPQSVSYLILTPTDVVLYLRAIMFLISAVACMGLYRRRADRPKAAVERVHPPRGR